MVLVLSEKRFPVRSIPATSIGNAIDTRSLLRRADGVSSWGSISSLSRQEPKTLQRVHFSFACSFICGPSLKRGSKRNAKIRASFSEAPERQYELVMKRRRISQVAVRALYPLAA